MLTVVWASGSWKMVNLVLGPWLEAGRSIPPPTSSRESARSGVRWRVCDAGSSQIFSTLMVLPLGATMEVYRAATHRWSRVELM